jgi:hypothetical protein
VNSIDQRISKPGDFAFVTLTYAKAFPTAAASKKDLDVFWKRFERAWGLKSMIWKLEPQKRGAPHFHLLVHMTAGFDHLAVLEWSANAWHDIAGGGDRHHLKWHLGMLGNRPCVEVVRDWQGVANYAGKYLGKVTQGDEEWSHPGRYWAIRREELLPITMSTHDVSARTAALLRRVCVRWFERQRSGWFYIPGKRLLSGRHRSPSRMSGKSLISLSESSDAVRVSTCIAQLSELLDVQIRPQLRRWRSSRGGFSGFMPAEQFERLLLWAEREAVSGFPAG